MNENAEIVFYGDPNCADSRAVKMFLLQHGVAYLWVDIVRDPGGRAFVEEVNSGEIRVPTLCFPDGRILVEPSIPELAEALGIK